LQQAQRRVDEVNRHNAGLRRLIAYRRSLAQDAFELLRLLEIFEHSLELAQKNRKEDCADPERASTM
jgi:hypothetical protein